MSTQAYRISFDGEAVEDEFYGDVVSLTVEENTDTASSLHLRLAIRQSENGAWSYLDDERLAVFSKISAEVGFTGGGGLADALGGITGGGGNEELEPVFDGYISAMDLSLGSQPGETFLDVAALDTSILLNLEEKIARWPNLSDADIAQQIVAAYGVPVVADTTATVHQENDTTVIQRATDLDFVRSLARRNGLEFYFETDKDSKAVTAYFRAPQLESGPQPDLAVQFGEESNLTSFSAHLTGLMPLNVKVTQTDIKSASANSGQASDTALTKLGASDANTVVGGPLGGVVSPSDAQAQVLVLGSPSSDATELQTAAQAVRDEAGWFITAGGEINSQAYGNVLRPHRLVLVKGAGTPFSGEYYVTRVTHELTSDGSYKQRFEARRNARDVRGDEAFGGGGLGLPIPGL